MKLVYDGVDPSDRQAAISAAKTLRADDLNNPQLRQEEVGSAASIISAYPEVREILLQFQRDFAAQPEGAVLDGRDIGTVVCPDADCKLFITANIESRAKRRFEELEGQGFEVSFDAIKADLQERDTRDANRSVAPLIPAADAVVIDTSNLSADEVFARVKDIIGRVD
jgi:cytidylate kinase